MRTHHLTALHRRLAQVSSRRGLFAGFITGVLATDLNGTAAKRKGKRKKRKNKDRAQTRADARCADSNGSALAPAATDARLAQTFTAIRSGALVRAELEIQRDSPLGDFILQLATVDAFGIPTNEVLADAVVPSAQLPEGVSTVSFTFPRPATVVAGEQYALVHTRPEVGILWHSRQDNGCTGRAFASDDRTEPFQGAPLEVDLIFATFVRS